MPEETSDFRQRLNRIETLIQQIQAAGGPAVQASVEELMEILLEVHGTGLEHMLDRIWEASDEGKRIVHEELVGDALVDSLLVLHGLHPLSLEARVQQALEKVRPYMHSHGGDVQVLAIKNGVVRLRLEGSCEGCQSSTTTLKYAVEDAIYAAAPDVRAVVAEGVNQGGEEAADDAFIPLEQVPTDAARESANGRHGGKGVWHEVSGLAPLAEGTVRVKQIAGRSVLFCRLGDSFYAYRNECPSCHRSLGEARIEERVLTCPHCTQCYDVVRAGRGLDADGDLFLDPVPLLEEKKHLKVALPVRI